VTKFWAYQASKGKSIWSWPSGHATDSEEAIAFAQLQGIDCMVEKFPLEKSNEAFGRNAPALNLN
jgi:D-arabinose 1-dehydrogenase-like Zn-dependent alcohol dehydrogenase